MSFSRPIQWYHSHADPIWPDGTFFKTEIHCTVQMRIPSHCWHLLHFPLASGQAGLQGHQVRDQTQVSLMISCDRSLILLLLGTRNRLVDVKG
jgi:hypothetical protein